MFLRITRTLTLSRIAIAACVAILAAFAWQASDAKEPSVESYATTDHADMNHAGMNHGEDAEMTEEEMQAWVDAWFAVHPVVGQSVQGSPVITFRAFSNKFDYDSDLVNTPSDTVVIGVGDIVAWQRLIGAHTLTNGTGSSDPQVGTLFDVPLDSATPVFQYQYNVPGTYPFFCRTHEDFLMTGTVIVVGATATQQSTWGELKARNR